ncbi:hypothetical protein QBC42DRAFT_195144, partial [Cladorrhinum samala]
MPGRLDMQWPLSARGERPPSSVLSPVQGTSSNPLPPYPDDGHDDARALVASRLWGRERRYSDSFPQQSAQVIFQESLDRHNLASRTGLSFYIADGNPTSPQPREVDLGGSITHLPSPVQSPIRSTAAARYTPRPAQALQVQQASTTATGKSNAFMSWTEFTPYKLPRRLPAFSAKTHRQEVISAVSALSIPTIQLENVGKLARPIMNKYYRTEQALSEFLTTTERVLLLPNPSPSLPSNPPSQRFLERLESELFNTSKYLSSSSSSSSTQNLTVLTWSDDSPWGTATLFEVSLPPQAAPRPPPGIGLLARRRRNAQLPLLQTGNGDTSVNPNQAVSIHPVASMELIPRQALVNLRLDTSIRKLVLADSSSESGSGAKKSRFRWLATTAGFRSPVYATLYDPPDSDSDSDDDNDNAKSPLQPPTAYPTATTTATTTTISSALDDDVDAVLGPNRRRARKRRRHRASTDPRNEYYEKEEETDGIISTIPQFLALLHTSFSVVEEISSTPISGATSSEGQGQDPGSTRVETASGRRVRGVSLRDWPQGKKHTGKHVRVVVLMPDSEGSSSSTWTEEKIFWSDDVTGLRELKGKRYRDAIGRERRPR